MNERSDHNFEQKVINHQIVFFILFLGLSQSLLVLLLLLWVKASCYVLLLRGCSHFPADDGPLLEQGHEEEVKVFRELLDFEQGVVFAGGVANEVEVVKNVLEAVGDHDKFDDLHFESDLLDVLGLHLLAVLDSLEEEAGASWVYQFEEEAVVNEDLVEELIFDAEEDLLKV